MAEKSRIDRCEIALSVVGEVLREECAGSEETVIEFMKKLMGLKDDDSINSSSKCELVLKEGLSKDVCQDFKGIRRWVICRAFNMLVRKEAKTFSEAMDKAWDEAKLRCIELGAPI